MTVEEYTLRRIDQLCEKRGLTHYRLAQLSGLPQSSVANLFSRKSCPGIPLLLKLCKTFGISLAQFFAGDAAPPDLTPEQKTLLEIWETLDHEEKRLVTVYLQGLKHR